MQKNYYWAILNVIWLEPALTLFFTTSRRNNDEQNKRTNIPDLISMGKKRILIWSYFWNSIIMGSITAT